MRDGLDDHKERRDDALVARGRLRMGLPLTQHDREALWSLRPGEFTDADKAALGRSR